MANFARTFTGARRAQGFKSQAHLDAFFAYYDHQDTCPDCQHVTYHPFEDGVQPARAQCTKAIELFVASHGDKF